MRLGLLGFGLLVGLVQAADVPPGLPPQVTVPDQPQLPKSAPNSQQSTPATSPSYSVPVPSVSPGSGAKAAALPAVTEAIPPRIAVEHYQTLWERSPFELSIQSANAPPTGIAADWLLTSLSRVNGQPVAILVNKASGETAVVKNQTHGTHGLRLVTAQISTDYKQSKVRVARGAEEADLIFQEQDLSSLASLAPATQPNAGANVPGQPVPMPPNIQPGSPTPNRPPTTPRRLIIRPKPVTPPPST